MPVAPDSSVNVAEPSMGTRLAMSNSAITPRLEASWTFSLRTSDANRGVLILTESPMNPKV